MTAIKRNLLNASLFTAVLSLFHLIAHPQVDPKKLDSLSKSIDSSAKAFRNWQDSFAKTQDSIYQTAINKNKKKFQSSNQTLIEQKKQESTQRQRAILRFLSGVVIVIIGVIAWFWKRKTKT